MAAKEKYRLLLNLSLLGFGYFLSFFDIAIGQVNKIHQYNLSEEILVDKSDYFALEDFKNDDNLKKDSVALSIKIFADRQYDYDQNIYKAEGNVKAIINGGVLRSDVLTYDSRTGILSAKGNITFRKGGQYFRGEEFRYNLLKKEGIVAKSYGILDFKNVIKDLRIDLNSKNYLQKSIALDKSTNKKGINYIDGIEYSFSNIRIPGNKITRVNNSIGSINSWRFKSDLITIQENGWKANKIYFTNDPFDPNQISFEGIDVIAEENDDQLIVTSSKTNLILDRRTKIFLGKRRFTNNRKNRSKYELILDSKDRDGFVIVRNGEKVIINNNISLDFQPQFLINRAISGKTNSYGKGNTIYSSDLFGMNMRFDAKINDWNFQTINELSTLNIDRIFRGLRHSSSFRKPFKFPILSDSSLNIFTAYRYSAWNGTIGETEIKSAYGAFIEKSKYFDYGEIKNNLNFRLGLANYEAEKLFNNETISLWRSSAYTSLDSEYQIWKSDKENFDNKMNKLLSPILIYPELVLKTNINSAYFNYEDGSDQIFVKFSAGPEIRLGRLKRKFFDYTKFSFMPGIKVKSGNSPFKFDNAIDLKTINFSFLQQIYGPLMVDFESNLNIDNNSKNYGDYYDTKLGFLWHKRAYEFGVYYHPNNDAGGIYFRINGFQFDDSVKAIF